MAISERTPWQRNKIVRELWAEGSKEILKRLKTRNYRTYEYEKQRATEFIERAALVANYAIIKMTIKARLDEQKDSNHE